MIVENYEIITGLDVLNRVETFYESAFDNLTIIFVVGLTFVGIVVPIISAQWQKWKYDEIIEKIKKTHDEVLKKSQDDIMEFAQEYTRMITDMGDILYEDPAISGDALIKLKILSAICISKIKIMDITRLQKVFIEMNEILNDNENQSMDLQIIGKMDELKTIIIKKGWYAGCGNEFENLYRKLKQRI